MEIPPEKVPAYISRLKELLTAVVQKIEQNKAELNNLKSDLGSGKKTNQQIGAELARVWNDLQQNRLRQTAIRRELRDFGEVA
jgi:chromosome segregation ATPase